MGYPATVDTGQVQPFALFAEDIQDGGLSAGFAAGAIFIVGIVLTANVVITGMKCKMGTATGNIDMGIYDANFNLLVSKGATAAVASSVNTLTFANPISLAPGRYWLAWIDTVGTDTVYEANVSNVGDTIQRSVGTAFTQIAANASWQVTTARIALLAVVQGGYP